MSIKLNKSAPNFELPADDGTIFRLSEQTGRVVLLVFYPGDDTPVCTAQLCDYRDGIDAFKDLAVDVIGISADDIHSHQKFKRKYNLPFHLLADTQYEVARLYDCKGLLGMKRGVFLIDKGGILRYAHVEALPIFRRKREELLNVIEALPEVGKEQANRST